MTNRSTAATIDEYIAAFPPDVQHVLQEMRALIRAAAPQAVETISYAMPTFDLNGRHLVHFAAFKSHIGFYATPTAHEEFREALKPYKHAKGSVQFPLSQPLPTDLIRRMVEFRVRENSAGASKGRKPSANDDFPAELASPARRALAQAGYSRLEQLAGIRTSELLQLHGMGPKAVKQLGAALAARGLSLADEGSR